MFCYKEKPMALSAYQAECDFNYLRLKKLMGNFELTAKNWVLNAGRDQNRHTKHLSISTIRDSAYTIKLSIELALTNRPKKKVYLEVHVYRDVWSAEIIRYQHKNISDFEQRYQLNRFLGKWLRHYLTSGIEPESNNAIIPLDIVNSYLNKKSLPDR